jgi:uncharacterized protein with GYD domain
MPTYVVLYTLTEKGRKEIHNLADRMDEAASRAQATGIRVVGNYVTLGGYDLVTIVEAPDDATIARGAAAILERGNVVSTTMRAFTADEWRRATRPTGASKSGASKAGAAKAKTASTRRL